MVESSFAYGHLLQSIFISDPFNSSTMHWSYENSRNPILMGKTSLLYYLIQHKVTFIMRRSIIYMYNRSILRGNDISLSTEKYGKLCSTMKELNFRSNYNAAEKS